MTALVPLGPRLTDLNAGELIEAACGRTQDELLELLAARLEKADVPDRVEPLPGGRELQEMSGEVVPEPLLGSDAAANEGTPSPLDVPAREPERRRCGIVDPPRAEPTRRSMSPPRVPVAVKRACAGRREASGRSRPVAPFGAAVP